MHHSSKKPTPKHSLAQRAHLKHVKKKSGPSAVRRRERRAELQPKPATTDSTPDTLTKVE